MIPAISAETLTIILAASIPVLTAVGSIVTAIVTTSHSASKEQVKELKEWIETLDARLDDEVALNKAMKAELEAYQNERDQAREEARKLSEDVETLSAQLKEKTSKVAEQDKKIREQDKKIREQDQQIATMGREIESLRLEVRRLVGEDHGE
jgi:chromosome segregation ATPase